MIYDLDGDHIPLIERPEYKVAKAEIADFINAQIRVTVGEISRRYADARYMLFDILLDLAAEGRCDFDPNSPPPTVVRACDGRLPVKAGDPKKFAISPPWEGAHYD